MEGEQPYSGDLVNLVTNQLLTWFSKYIEAKICVRLSYGEIFPLKVRKGLRLICYIFSLILIWIFSAFLSFQVCQLHVWYECCQFKDRNRNRVWTYNTLQNITGGLKIVDTPKNDAHEPPLSLKVFFFNIHFFWRDSGCTFENSELCSPAFESKQEHLNQHFLKPIFFLPAKLQILSSLPAVVPFPYLELNARAARHSRRPLPSTTSLTVSSWLYWSTLNPLDRSSRIRGVFFLMGDVSVRSSGDVNMGVNMCFWTRIFWDLQICFFFVVGSEGWDPWICKICDAPQ